MSARFRSSLSSQNSLAKPRSLSPPAPGAGSQRPLVAWRVSLTRRQRDGKKAKQERAACVRASQFSKVKLWRTFGFLRFFFFSSRTDQLSYTRFCTRIKNKNSPLPLLSVLQGVVQLRPPLRPDEGHRRPRQLPPVSPPLGLEQQDRLAARSDAKQVAYPAHGLLGVPGGIDPKGRVAVVEGGGDAVGLFVVSGRGGGRVDLVFLFLISKRKRTRGRTKARVSSSW